MSAKNKKSILIIEDNQEYTKTLLKTITQKFPECRIVTSADGADAIFKVSNEFFSIIISDNNLPKKNGIDVIDYIIRNKLIPCSKIIFMSGEMDLDNTQKAIRLGIKKILVKPFSFEQILKHIDEIFKSEQPLEPIKI